MKKLNLLFVALIICAAQIFAADAFAPAAASAKTQSGAYTLDFSDEDLEDKVSAAFVQKMYGKAEEISSHWSVDGSVLKRINDCDGEDVTGNYATVYLNDCYLRYFELNTKIAYGENGLTGVVFGKNDIKVRHLADGNAVYFMPGANVELAGSTITKKETSATFAEKSDYYDFKLIVCADYVKVFVDGREYIDAAVPSELIRYGKVGLFTANAAGSFSGGVEIYNLDEHGNRIDFENYTAATGVIATNKTVEINLSDDKVKYEYTVQPVGATVKGVRFLSINPDIAVVDNEGYIHPLKAGVTEIEVITADGGFTDSIIVTVNEVIPEIEGVVLDKSEGTIDKIGGKIYLSASHYPEDAENQGYKWSTSNPRVAIVNNGTVTAMGEGTCVITVKDYYGNYSASCIVTVAVTASNESVEQKSGGCAGSVGVSSVSLLLFGAAAIMALMRREKR